MTIVPVGDVENAHRLWAAKDYKIDMQYLPKGLVMFDLVQIEYAQQEIICDAPEYYLGVHATEGNNVYGLVACFRVSGDFKSRCYGTK